MHIDAATAIARCPLFKSLGRLELARLSAELEEITLAPGTVLFEKGDPGDAFYVVRSGQAQVYSKQQDLTQTRILLGPGQVFGEMALLTGEGRSSSIMAFGDLELWRMSDERFFALLSKDRKIAQSIEQTLSRRLNETMQRQNNAVDASNRLLRVLGGTSRRLMACLAQRPRWPARTIKVLRDSDAEMAAELDRLIEQYHLLMLEDGDVVMDASLIEILSPGINSAGREWLGNLASRLTTPALADEAVVIYLLAGHAEQAAAIIIEHAPSLVSGHTEKERREWLTRLAEAKLNAPLLDKVRTHLALVEEPVVPKADPGSFASTEADGPPWWQRIKVAKSLAVAISLALIMVGMKASLPSHLSRPGFEALMLIAATIPVLLVEVLPNYIISIMLAAALVVPGIVEPDVVLSGFSSSSWLMMVALFALSGAIAKSGLMYRLALAMLKRLPGNMIVLSTSLLGLAALLTSGIASSSSRATLAAPSIRDLTDAMRLKARSPGTAFLGIAGFQMFVGLGSLFITASSTNLLLQGMMPEVFRAKATWLAWFAASLVPHVLLFALLLPVLFLIYRPKISNPVDHDRINVQLSLLGKVTRDEKLSIIALVLLGVGFATRPLHGIPDVWVAVGVCVMFFATRMLNDSSFQGNVNWGVMIYSGVLMSLNHVLASLKVDTWLIDVASSSLHATLVNPYVFVFTIAALSAGLRFLIPAKTLSPLMALVAIPLAISIGINPLVAVLAVLISVDHTFFPFLNSSYAPYYHAMGGHLFSDAQARPALWAEFFLRIIALTLSVACWRWMGLIPG